MTDEAQPSHRKGAGPGTSGSIHKLVLHKYRKQQVVLSSSRTVSPVHETFDICTTVRATSADNGGLVPVLSVRDKTLDILVRVGAWALSRVLHGVVSISADGVQGWRGVGGCATFA